MLTLVSNIAFSQNEPYRGGNGDGFGEGNSQVINMNEVNFDGAVINVTINQSVSQVDPTSIEPVVFTAVFTEPVADFVKEDITIIGTPNPDVTINGDGTTFTIEVRNIEENGDISALILPGVAHNSVNNPNQHSTSTDNLIAFEGVTTDIDSNERIKDGYQIYFTDGSLNIVQNIPSLSGFSVMVYDVSGKQQMFVKDITEKISISDLKANTYYIVRIIDESGMINKTIITR